MEKQHLFSGVNRNSAGLLIGVITVFSGELPAGATL